MRRILALGGVAFVACNRTAPEGELTRAECADLVRHVQKLESADTGGLRDALNVGLRCGIEGCLARGTVRARECTLRAENLGDLESCNAYFK